MSLDSGGRSGLGITGILLAIAAAITGRNEKAQGAVWSEKRKHPGHKPENPGKTVTLILWPLGLWSPLGHHLSAILWDDNSDDPLSHSRVWKHP